MSGTPKPEVVEMLEKALEQARRGEVSSAVLLTMNGRVGHTGRWAQITSDEDARALPREMKKMETGMRELVPDGPW